MDLRPVERKLAAILAADVAGYSRLMAADEEGTLAQLKAHRRALIDPKIREHHGKIIKTTGDGMLVEFPSVVDAVRCAVEVQRGMGERNAGVPADKRIEFRVGINLGDILHDEKDIFGDGVNIAARLEGLAEPGGICVSRAVRDPVRERLGFTFEDIGEQALKNIPAPIHAYRVRFGGAEPGERVMTRPLRRNTIAAAGLGGLVAACLVGAVGLYVWRSHAQPSAHVATSENAPLPLPDKPSVAVLPFINIGGDAKQERLADGITEDVITDLSRYRSLFVIASNSVFAYKGKAVSVQQIGRDLGVRYVLEGSIQTSGDRIRVTAQLIEAAANTHVWSERYERPLDDIFDVQNEVTQKIAAALAGLHGVLGEADADTVRRKPPANLKAYDYYILATQLKAHTSQTREDVGQAEAFLKKAIELDPLLARAYVLLGGVYDLKGNMGWGDESSIRLFERAKAELQRAVALDSSDARAYAQLGEIFFLLSDSDQGVAACDQARLLNPNDPEVLVMCGYWLFAVGRSGEGVEMINRAFRLNPHYPAWYDNMVDPFYATGDYNQVIRMVRRTRGEIPVWSQMLLTISYAQLGLRADAAAQVPELLRRYPDFSMERFLSDFGSIKDQPTLARYLEGSRRAGLPECATQAELQKYRSMTHLALCDAKRATN